MEATAAAIKSQELPNGRVAHSDLRRPYLVRVMGANYHTRSFGSLAAARRYATTTGSYSIFFEYEVGSGHFLEGSR